MLCLLAAATAGAGSGSRVRMRALQAFPIGSVIGSVIAIAIARPGNSGETPGFKRETPVFKLEFTVFKRELSGLGGNVDFFSLAWTV